MEVWVSGLNQHTANVPNRKVPKVRILLLPQNVYNCHCPSGLGVGPQNLQHWFESNMAVIYI